MMSAPIQKTIRILTRRETRDWYSPYSAFLRERRRERIVAECKRRAMVAGRTSFAIFDADENLVLEGVV